MDRLRRLLAWSLIPLWAYLILGALRTMDDPAGIVLGGAMVGLLFWWLFGLIHPEG